jgi:hypothetical protein
MRVDRGHVDLCAQSRLRNSNWYGYMNIVPHAPEDRVRSCLDNQEQVPRRSAARTRIALACKTYPLSIACARFDAKLQRFLARYHTLAVTCGARILHASAAAATRTLDVELHPPTHLRYLARAMALRAFYAATRVRLTFTS